MTRRGEETVGWNETKIIDTIYAADIDTIYATVIDTIYARVEHIIS